MTSIKINAEDEHNPKTKEDSDGKLAQHLRANTII